RTLPYPHSACTAECLPGADHHGIGSDRCGDPARVVIIVPRVRHPAAVSVLGPDAAGVTTLHAPVSVYGAVSRRRDRTGRLQLQYARRRPARCARPATARQPLITHTAGTTGPAHPGTSILESTPC